MTAGSVGGQERQAARVEPTARAWWAHTQQQTTRYELRGSLIAASNKLADEVLAVIARRGIAAESHHVVVDPGMPYLVTQPDPDDPDPDYGQDSVMMITTRRDNRDVIVPICPATTTLRVYDRQPSEKLGELITTVTVRAEKDGWTTPHAIVEALFGPAGDPEPFPVA